MATTPKFAKVSHSFHTELKKRVQQYFDNKGISQTGDSRLFTKAIVLMLALIAVYVHLVFFSGPVWLSVLECIILGGVVSAIGFNVMHDGGHGSFSQSKSLNTLASFSLNLLGGSSFMWNVKHNIIHHTYTNVDGVDDDIDVKPWMRMSTSQKKYKMHKYQHIYFWFLYSLLYVFWIFVSDYKKYFSKKIGDMPLKKMHTKDHLVFWSFKILNLFLYVVLPIYMVGFTHWLIGFTIFMAFSGLVLSLVFQLAHTVEHTAFPMPDDQDRFDDEWAVHQLKTTANFATDNKLVCWLVGGLNFQVEHHLFPKISHVHYPEISKIIQQACADFNIPYIVYPKVRQAVASHISHLKHVGTAA